MPLESSPQSISDLDPSWPVAGDSTTDGDDHIRNIKRVLQTMFPDGPGGIGFGEPVLSTVEELNYLQGVTSNVQDQIDSLNGGASAGKLFLAAPDGAVLTWFQPTAPAGWTFIDLTQQTFSLCLSPSTLVGHTEGTDSPTEWRHSHAVQPFTLTTPQIPPHSHAMRYTTDAATGVYSYINGNEQRLPTRGGTTTAGETELNSIAAQAVTQAITAESTFRPYVYHCTLIFRDSDLDV